MSPKAPLLIVLAVGLASFASAQDSVRLVKGTTESGRIQSEDFDTLKLKVKKGNTESVMPIAWDDVAEISYGLVPEFTKALGEINTGQSAAAIPRLKGMLTGTLSRPELRPAIAFQLGSAQMRSGAFADATATFLDLVKDKVGAKSRYLIPATRSLVEIALTTNDPNAGTAAVDTATSAAKEAGVSVTGLVVFDYFRGLLNEAKNDAVNARVSFQAASRGDGPAAAIADMAKLGVARIEAAAGKLEEARSAYRTLVDKGRGNEVLAGAWNGLAKMALADGVKAKNAEKINDALFMYLRGVVVYAPAPGEGTGEYERALAGAAEAFKSLAEIETDENLKKENAARARARLEQLKKEFPYSVHLPK